MKRVLAVLLGLALALVGSKAVAAWLSTGSASATATATSVAPAHAPVAGRAAGHVDLSWSASTLTSGAPVGGYRVLRHDGSDTTEVCSVPAATLSCPDTSPVATAVTYGVVATIGSTWQGPESPTTSFTYDDVAPVTTANVSPTPSSAGWNNTSVLVTLQATDAGSPASGVDHLTYAIDGGAPVTVSAPTTSFPVSGSGTHTVTYTAVDHAGNAETPGATPVRIDPDSPVTAVTRTPLPNDAGWNHGDVTLDLSATDVAGAGVASVTVGGVSTPGATASTTVTAEGTTSVSYFATDAAGNVEGTRTAVVKIDHTAPTASIDPADSSAWTTDDTVAITAADALSGVASVQYRVDGGPAQSYGGTPFHLADGSHDVEVTVTDLAGNTLVRSATIKVDTVTPTSSIASTTPTTWTVTASDAAPSSGVSVEWWIDSGSHTVAPGTSTVVTVSPGSHTIHWFAEDAAGNRQAQQDLAVNVAAPDTTAPTVTNLMGGGTTWHNDSNGAGSWNKDACTTGNRVCATTADNGSPSSGVKASTIYFTLTRGSSCWDGTAFVSGGACQVPMTYTSSTGSLTATVPQTAMADGAYTLKIHVEDNAGNVREESITFTIR